LPVRKSASTKQKESYDRCVDHVKVQNNKRKTMNLNPWAICNASVFGLLKSQENKS
tara:strand:- start:1210 stop:1377 length:168 start_codon:yes stop_codon:yes gene_type:complete